jgi:hypothetical protein
MDTLIQNAVCDRAVELADAYASAFIACMPNVRSSDELQSALSGLLLTYVAEVAGVS